MAEARQDPFIAARHGHVVIKNVDGHYFVTSETEDHSWFYEFPTFTKRWEAQPSTTHVRASQRKWGQPGHGLTLVGAACLIAWADFQLTPDAVMGKGLIGHVNTARRRFKALQTLAASEGGETPTARDLVVVSRDYKAEQRALTLDALDHGQAWMWPIAKLVFGHMDLEGYYPKYEPEAGHG